MASPTPVVSQDPHERWTSTVVLGDGTTAAIRPITPDDAPALAEFHVRQSPESRYRRFFSPKPTLRESDLRRFTNVDFVDRVALVVEDHGDFIAWASYERLQNRDDAEVAFMVDDRCQGRGVATLLLEHLAAIAKTNGIERFTAQTLADNRSMLAVFAKAGWPVHRRFDSGVIDVDFPLANTSEYIDSVERREHRADSRAVARLLLPRSIAVIGASDSEGSVGQLAWKSVSSTPDRQVVPVNPRHDTIDGRRAYASVADVPHEIGLAIIAVPLEALEVTIQQCIDERVRGAVVITAVPDGSLDIDAIVANARRNGLRIIGPSSFGIASPRPETELQAALVDVDVPAGHVAVSMQSGTLATSLLLLAQRLGVGLSWFVSLGDKADLSANDLLQFWEDDEATKVIALYTESLGNPRKFARIARRVAATKPIVVVRTGAALVGTANAALYEQTGVIQVPTVAALLDTARVFATQPLMAGGRVAVISNAKSPFVLTAATLDATGLEVAASPSLDWRTTPDDYADALRTALADDDVDAAIVIHAPPTFSAVDGPIDAIADAADGSSKPVVAVMLGTVDGPLAPESPIPTFSFPEQAAAVLSRLAAYSAWRRTETAGESDIESTPIDRAGAEAIVARHLDAGEMPPEPLADLLAGYGVAMPVTRLVDAADAVSVANAIGYPVAVKAIGRRVGRSVEAGIALDLSDDGDVEEIVGLMIEHLGDDAERVYVQRMVPPGADLRIRVTHDERIGPVVTVGIGGLQADAIGDESSRLAPVSSATALSMVSATRAAALLDEAELHEVADQVTRVAQLASDHAEIAELDLNPVIVSDEGCWVADARIVLRRDERRGTVLRRLD
ncbi:GNAT family N-acetyltransferase [Ilumatobacter sp.]|uniref:bifunctional acetate--CoA ligase family protein/GNAT family N-acetyltransferase n=1 Tax=Ilumatobacter sp. TaxID=1967498 RepID=UPI003AF47EF4